MSSFVNTSSSFDSPMRPPGNCGEFAKPQFSPMYASSPRYRNESSDFIPFGPSSPGPIHRGRGRWRGKNRSFLSNTSTSSGPNSSFSSGPRSSPYNRSPHGHWRGRGNQGNPRNQSQITNISVYYHPSMLEDPWAKLEEQLENSISCSSSSTKAEVENDDRSSDTESSVEQSTEICSQESVS